MKQSFSETLALYGREGFWLQGRSAFTLLRLLQLRHWKDLRLWQWPDASWRVTPPPFSDNRMHFFSVLSLTLNPDGITVVPSDAFVSCRSTQLVLEVPQITFCPWALASKTYQSPFLSQESK